jgi:PAS domain S-box-containing protein
MDMEQEIEALKEENAELRTQLAEALETVRAIGGGEVDAVLVGDQVYTLQSSDAASNRFRGEILAQVSDVVIAVDNDDRVIYFNSAAERQYDVSASEVLGRKLSAIYSEEWHSKQDKTDATKDLADKGLWRGENEHVRPGDDRIQVESIVTRMNHLDGSSSGKLAVIRDISERKRTEAALHHAHEELELRVRERTSELAEANRLLKIEIQERKKTELQRQKLVHKLVTMQENERSRIARDLHDHLGQRVTALRLQIASILSTEIPPEIVPRYKKLQETAVALDAEVGSLAWELRPAALDDLGLTAAAQAFLDEWSEQFEIQVQFNVRGVEAERLDPDIETHLYRIMQESLNNIVKHARATQVNVMLERRGETASLIVEDNGKGFDPTSRRRRDGKSRGLGLLGMQERAALVGGSLQIESNKRSGTTVFATVPCSLPE